MDIDRVPGERSDSPHTQGSDKCAAEHAQEIAKQESIDAKILWSIWFDQKD